MIHISAPTDDIGIAVLAETARATATQHGGGAEAAALVVRLFAQDARKRHTVATPTPSCTSPSGSTAPSCRWSSVTRASR